MKKTTVKTARKIKFKMADYEYEQAQMLEDYKASGKTIRKNARVKVTL
jgi:hypothetical protein